MKRYMMTLMAVLLAWTGMNAMDYETAREQAYYLTDKMAYELNLNDQQYNDAYEINLDYLLSVRTEADLLDVRYLAHRNADLRHILYSWQWAAYTAADYLFRPLHWLNGGWYFPVYRYYTHGFYFYHRPTVFWDYRGGHGRFYFSHGYYHNRRPTWHSGMRGEHRGLVGHPNPGGGRYGTPSHNTPHGHRGTFDMRTGRFDNHSASTHRDNGHNYRGESNNNYRGESNRSFRGESTPSSRSFHGESTPSNHSFRGESTPSSRSFRGESNHSSLGNRPSTMGSTRPSTTTGNSRPSITTSSSRFTGGSRSSSITSGSRSSSMTYGSRSSSISNSSRPSGSGTTRGGSFSSSGSRGSRGSGRR